MNLIKGKMIVLAKERDAALERLERDIYQTLKKNELITKIVLNACDKFSKQLNQEHIDLLIQAGVSPKKAENYVEEVKTGLNKENLKKRLAVELGHEWEQERLFLSDETKARQFKQKILPLGTLLHITPGNQIGTALYSVVEGLLTGNINLIKLASSDNVVLSARILLELIEIEPILKDYIYLFDYTSNDTTAIQQLMDLADAIVVWGGDLSIEAIRKMADAKTKIIEWGHKISFAYVSQDELDQTMLDGLAENIAKTNQLLCSSCQGIYLDTNAMTDVYAFCQVFLPILEKAYDENEDEIPVKIRAKTGLMVYTKSLVNNSCKVFHGKGVSLLAHEDSGLETAIPYGNCWVKRLPREQLMSTLRPHKNHLQTVGLLCHEADKEILTQLLWKAGVDRVTQGRNMSMIYPGDAHDGEYSLRRYVRIVSQEMDD